MKDRVDDAWRILTMPFVLMLSIVGILIIVTWSKWDDWRERRKLRKEVL